MVIHIMIALKMTYLKIALNLIDQMHGTTRFHRINNLVEQKP